MQDEMMASREQTTFEKIMGPLVSVERNDSQTAPICLGTLKELCYELDQYKSMARTLKRHADKMKDDVLGLIDLTEERVEWAKDVKMKDIEGYK